MSWDRQSPNNPFTGRRSRLPKPGELAAMVRDGLTVDDIADALSANASTVAKAMSNAGFDSTTGMPRTTPSPDREPPPPPLVVPGPWVEQALCSQVDPEIFYVDKGGSTREAKQTCARCPVAAECLDFALANGEQFGVWGGTSERERRRLTGRTRTIRCVECGTEFEVARSVSTVRYCGEQCRAAARRRHDNRYRNRRTA